MGQEMSFYVVLFADGGSYEATNAVSLRDALLSTAKYTGDYCDLLRKGMNGCDDDDYTGMICMFNHFAYTDIFKVYKVAETVYTEGK